MGKTLKNVSILTAGEARGHNLIIDEQSLREALAVAQTMGRIKVTNGHGATQVLDILGFVENFRIEGNRLLGDLTLLDSEKARYVEDLAKAMPDQFGLSITFAGVAREVDGKRFASVTEIYDVSMVPQPAANKSLFSAFSALPVDTLGEGNMEKDLSAKTAEVKTTVAVAEATRLGHTEDHKEDDKEPTLRDVIQKLDALLGYYTDDKKMKREEELAAVAEEADEEPAAEEAKPETVEAQAKPDHELTALRAENARLKVEMEAARGTAPLATEKVLNRTELLAQFNEEKDPRRAAEIFNRIKLAR
jgi:hypothetical protein